MLLLREIKCKDGKMKLLKREEAKEKRSEILN